MPVPMDDLPDDLRGTAVPMEDIPFGGEPRRGAAPSRARAANEAASQRVRAANEAARQERIAKPRPITAFPELNEPTVDLDPLEAQNQGNADAGAVATNLIADSTVNLPGQATGFLGKVAGQVGRNFDPSIDPSQWRQNATILQAPRSQRGDELMGAALLPAVESWEKNVSPVLEKYPLLGAAAETLGTAAEGAGWLLGGKAAGDALGAARAQSRAGALAHNPYARSPVADVAQRYTVVPGDAQQSARTVTQSDMRGSTRAKLGPQVTNSEVPIRNAGIATQRAVADMPEGNLVDPNGRVDAGLLEGAIERQAVPYKQVATLPAPQMNTLADRLTQAWQTRGASLKGDPVTESRLMPLMDPNAPPLSTEELLTRWREINGYASKLRKQVGEGSAAAQIQSGDLRAIADTLLDEIDDRAAAFGQPQLIADLKQARVNIARLHTLDDALDSTGWLDATKLVAMAENGVPLTGELAQIAADAAAAPRSFTPLKQAVNNQDAYLDQFGREPMSWMRTAIGHLGGNRAARQGVEALNRDLREGSGLLRREPPPVVVPPLQPPPEPFGPPFPTGARSPVPPPAPNSAPLGPFDLQGSRFADEMLNLELVDPMTGNVPGAGVRGFQQAPDVLPWEDPGQVAPVSPAAASGDFAGQLGAVPPDPGLDVGVPRGQLNPGPRGPRDVNRLDATNTLNPRPQAPPAEQGFAASMLSDEVPWTQPELVDYPRGFRLLQDDTPGPLGPDFGPADEFPVPVAPRGPGPQGGPVQSSMFADEINPPAGDVAALEARAMGGEDVIPPADVRMFRGVPEGVDPRTPNERGFTTWSNRRPVAETYGPVIGEEVFDPTTNVHLGQLEEARQILGLPPEATAQDIAAAAMARYRDANRSISYDLRPELDGTPREYVMFGDQ